MNTTETTTIATLKKLLDGASTRHRVLANNLANVNTPGYRRQDVHFKDALVGALQQRSSAAIDAVEPELVQYDLDPGRPDGNNISTQTELGEMSQNELLYRVSAKALQQKYSNLRKAMQTGA